MRHKKSNLQAVYNRSFLSYIVVPITVIIIVVLAALYYTERKAQISGVDMLHNNVAEHLSSQVDAYSLQLAHLLLVNDKQTLELAASYSEADDASRYWYVQQLTQIFNSIVLPEQNVIALHYYLKDGRHLDFKGELAMPVETIREQYWYSEALAHPNRVYTDVANIDITYRMRGEKRLVPLVFAIAPERYDRRHAVEMVCLYTYVDLDTLFTGQTRNRSFGQTSVLDRFGRPLFQTGTPTNFTMLASSTVPGLDWALQTEILGMGSTRFPLIALIVLSASALVFCLYFRFSRLYLFDILGPLHTLIIGMQRVQEGNLTNPIIPHGKAEIQNLLEQFNHMTLRLHQLILQNEREQKERYLEQLKALQAQINPHFLTNTLNSIRFMAIAAHYDSIRDMTQALMDILNNSLQDLEQYHPVEKEIELLKSYLSIVQIQHMDRFDVRFELDPAAMDCRIPRLILQPVVENSIQHGLGDCDGEIVVRTRVEDKLLVLEVEDNGVGTSPDVIREALEGRRPPKGSGHSIGLYNVHHRLRLNFGDRYGLQVQSRMGEYTRTTAHIPAQYGRRKEEYDVQSVDC